MLFSKLVGGIIDHGCGHESDFTNVTFSINNMTPSMVLTVFWHLSLMKAAQSRRGYLYLAKISRVNSHVSNR